jgi:hypothetical protein
MESTVQILLKFGGILLLGLATDAIGQRTFLPRVTLMLLFGAIIGLAMPPQAGANMGGAGGNGPVSGTPAAAVVGYYQHNGILRTDRPCNYPAGAAPGAPRPEPGLAPRIANPAAGKH